MATAAQKKVVPGVASQAVQRTHVITTTSYDEAEDLKVPHSGTIDPRTGRHRFDETKVGGVFAREFEDPDGDGMLQEFQNNKGHIIDPDTGDFQRTPCVVLNPELYVNKDESQF